MSLEKGIVPENWKLALVNPLLKKLGMDLVFENFRPVNNLHFLTKVAKKVVTSQLVNHCNENAPLPVNRSAYRQLHSTETALLKAQNDILINMDNEEVTLLVMLDMSAAFDTIDHNILIDILKNDFGVVDSARQWFISYLANRKQQVVIDRCKSSEFMVATGVPQSSCLGPVLFLLSPSHQTPLKSLQHDLLNGGSYCRQNITRKQIIEHWAQICLNFALIYIIYCVKTLNISQFVELCFELYYKNIAHILAILYGNFHL